MEDLLPKSGLEASIKISDFDCLSAFTNNDDCKVGIDLKEFDKLVHEILSLGERGNAKRSQCKEEIPET